MLGLPVEAVIEKVLPPRHEKQNFASDKRSKHFVSREGRTEICGGRGGGLREWKNDLHSVLVFVGQPLRLESYLCLLLNGL